MACTITGVAEEEMNLKYRSLGENLYRLGDTGYIIEHWKNFIGDDYLIRFPDFVPYKVTANGAPAKSYGNWDRYFSGKYQRATVYNHYNGFYGGDRSELILKTDRPEKKTLLMFSNSYADAIKLLLLQHYDAIYAIDPRFYEKEMGKKFNAQKYIEKHEIDDVLILGDVQFFIRPFGLSGR